MEDIVETLGSAVLPHHLRRLVDLMMEESDRYLTSLGLKTPPRSVSAMMLLEKRGVASITEIARGVRLSHPYVIRMVGILVKAGLVEEVSNPSDRRARLLQLTALGKEEARTLAVVGAKLVRAYGELSEEINVDLLSAITRAQEALAEKSLFDRLNEQEMLI